MRLHACTHQCMHPDTNMYAHPCTRTHACTQPIWQADVMTDWSQHLHCKFRCFPGQLMHATTYALLVQAGSDLCSGHRRPLLGGLPSSVWTPFWCYLGVYTSSTAFPCRLPTCHIRCVPINETSSLTDFHYLQMHLLPQNKAFICQVQICMSG